MKKLFTLACAFVASIAAIAQPASLPATPTEDASDVLSIYGHYGTADGFKVADGSKNTGGVEEVEINGTNVYKIGGLDYVKFGFTSMNLTNYKTLHVDYYATNIDSTVDPTESDNIKISIQQSGAGSATQLTQHACVREQWKSVDLDISSRSFTEAVQFILASTGRKKNYDVYIANVYAYEKKDAVTPDPTPDANGLVVKPYYTTTNLSDESWEGVSGPTQYEMAYDEEKGIYTCELTLQPSFVSKKDKSTRTEYVFLVCDYNSTASKFDKTNSCTTNALSFVVKEPNTKVKFYGMKDASGKVHSYCTAMEIPMKQWKWQTWYTIGNALNGNVAKSEVFCNSMNNAQAMFDITGAASGKRQSHFYFKKEDTLTDASSGNEKVAPGFYVATYDPETFVISYKNVTYDSENPLTVTKKVTAAKAATLVLPFDAEIPAGVTAYTLNYTENAEEVIATKVNTLTAGQAVLLNADEGEYTFVAKSELSNPGEATGALNPIYMTQHMKDKTGSYVLQNGLDGVGFYALSDDDIATENFTISSYTAYLKAETSSAKVNIIFPENETDGIANVTVAENNAMFNLAGQRVDANAKGIVIKNGKKYLNK